MKNFRCCILLLMAMLANGCILFHHHRSKPIQPAQADGHSAPVTPAPPPVTIKPIVTPDHSITAKVVAYNSAGRFVVMTFPVGQMPRMDQTLFLYRNGLKVGQVKITGPQRDNDIVADLVTGTAQVGDNVREQ